MPKRRLHQPPGAMHQYAGPSRKFGPGMAKQKKRRDPAGVRRGNPMGTGTGNPIPVAQGELSRSKYVFGTPTQHSIHDIYHRINSTKRSAILRVQGISRQDVGSGKIQIPQLSSGTNPPAATDTVYMPMRMYDLTSAVNFRQTASVYNYGIAAWSCYRTRADASASPLPSYTFSVDGSCTDLQTGATGSGNAGYWDFERTDGVNNQTSEANVPMRQCILDWVDARFCFYGCNKIYTHYDVDLIQLKQDHLHPGWVVPTTDTTATPFYANLAAERVAFWDAVLKNYTYNQIDVNNERVLRSGMTVLHRRRCPIQPKISTESDAYPHQHIHKEFFNFHRHCRYDWAPDQQVQDFGTTTALVQGKNQSIADFAATVAPKARVYLLVRAVCTTINTGSYTADTWPTFDVLIRKKITTIL